jgi:hypothetical protein
MAITKEWLKQAALAKSFSKGEEYYDDVDDVVKIGNSYTATVYGSEEYEVMITDIEHQSPLAECDCPYDHGGICKHIVAVALNIIDGNFESDEEAETPSSASVSKKDTPSVIPPIQLPTFTFYEEFFLKKEEALRTAFLRQLFSNDDKLRRQFYEYSKPKEDAKTVETKQNVIEKTAEKLNAKLSKIADLDPNDYYSRGRGRYDDYYDGEGDEIVEWIEEKIQAVFTPFEIEIKLILQNGNISTATEMLVGLFEGCLGLEFEGDLQDYMGDEFEDVAHNMLDSLIDTLKDALKTTIFHEKDIQTSTLLVLNRWAKRKNNLECVLFFEDYFIYISARLDIATWLIEEMKMRKLTLDFINLTLANAETVKNDALWISSAESVAKSNTTVMQLLLDKFLALNRLEEFHKYANVAAKNFENSHFIPYLKTKVLVDYDKELYINVHLRNAADKYNLDDFLTVRSLLSKQKEADFIEKCKKEKQNLYVDILNKDGNLAGILAFIEAQGKPSSGYFYYSFDMQKALSYIIGKFPDDVFDIVQFQTNQALKNMKMDRSGYASACSHLKPLKNLPKSHQMDLKTFLESLRSRFVSRPAFLDELRKIGVG